MPREHHHESDVALAVEFRCTAEGQQAEILDDASQVVILWKPGGPGSDDADAVAEPALEPAHDLGGKLEAVARVAGPGVYERRERSPGFDGLGRVEQSRIDAGQEIDCGAAVVALVDGSEGGGVAEAVQAEAIGSLSLGALITGGV